MVSSKLLDAAIDQFGRRGFEGASTREIARASGTAMSSITYHFGGKEGLYLAAAEHIARCIAEVQGPVVASAREAGLASREAAVDAILTALDSFATMMLHPQSQAWARFIMREQQEPTEAFERLYQGVMAPVSSMFIELVAAARPDLADAEVRATAILLFGQAMTLRACRAAVMRVLGVDRLDEAAGELLRRRLRANALCILSEKTG